MDNASFDQNQLVKVLDTTMPFGKYKGRPIIDLPQAYLLWFSREGFPRGELGQLMQLALEIDHNGLKPMVKRIKNG